MGQSHSITYHQDDIPGLFWLFFACTACKDDKQNHLDNIDLKSPDFHFSEILNTYLKKMPARGYYHTPGKSNKSPLQYNIC
jgi:hypothetical protein